MSLYVEEKTEIVLFQGIMFLQYIALISCLKSEIFAK